MAIGISAVVADDLGMDYSGAADDTQKEKRLVKVTWRDILSCSGWEKAPDVNSPQFISVGWLVSRDGSQVKIASTLDYEDAFDDSKDEAKPVGYGITAFPAGSVDDVEFI